MGGVRRLPDSEFEIMRAVWRNEPPVTTLRIMESLPPDKKKWKQQTALTMLVRLVEKGFLSSERAGRERNYTPLISEKEYRQIEAGDFMKRYSGGTIGSLVKTLCESRELSREDVEELREWLIKKEKRAAQCTDL